VRGLDLKAEIARSGLPIYVVAGQAKINPYHLSRVFNGRVPLDDKTAVRVMAAIQLLSDTVPQGPMVATELPGDLRDRIEAAMRNEPEALEAWAEANGIRVARRQ
jgi:hypothetical protein